MDIKSNFHQLIDAIDDDDVLQSYYDIIQHLISNKQGAIWNRLTDDQQQELILSYEESFDGANLISHDEMKKKHEKWLK